MILALLVALTLSPPARAGSAPEVCTARDDHADAAAVDAYFLAKLREHEQLAFARPLRESARTQAKIYLEQRVTDKRAELCAAHLKLVEDVKSAPARFASPECGSAAVAALLDQYAAKAAGTFEQNQQLLTSLLNEHLKSVKRKLFDIARGATSGLEGSFRGQPLATAPQEARFEWLKQEASKLGAEARAAWGSAEPNANPLVQRNLELGREALRARQERDAAKARLHTDGRLPASCKPK